MIRRFQKWLCRFLGWTSTEPGQSALESAVSRQKESFKEEIERYDRSLAARANLCELLHSQIKKLETEELRLRTALEAQVKAGGAEEAGGELALRWQATVDELAHLREQAREAESRCAEIRAAREQALEAARQKLAEMQKALGED